ILATGRLSDLITLAVGDDSSAFWQCLWGLRHGLCVGRRFNQSGADFDWRPNPRRCLAQSRVGVCPGIGDGGGHDSLGFALFVDPTTRFTLAAPRRMKLEG